MNQQELKDRIAVLEQEVKYQRNVVLSCIHRKPAIREAKYLQELLEDLEILKSQIVS